MSQRDGFDAGSPDHAFEGSRDDRAGQTAGTRTEGEGETVDVPEGMTPFAQGQVLGGRYQIGRALGRGGMGEVWRAFDLKLRVEVALKALRRDLTQDDRRLEVLRREVRSAREVVSPNVCRIFDLIEADGTELVSMEYVDGQTLLQVLQQRGPLGLEEAQDIASQFLAGLEAIHSAGLVHRDVKPENIMITRASRVVLMDFGLARQEASGSAAVSGTPAYMPPEQAAGLKLDARADVYSAGVVLAEMVSPEGIKSPDSRQSLWEGVRLDPPQLPDTPWAAVLAKAVAREPERRIDSASALIRALEERTLRDEDPLRTFRVGDWLAEPSLNRLVRGAETAHLPPRAMDLLAYLARHPGDVLARDTIIDAVWTEQFVGEAVLRRQIGLLREALGDDAARPTYIETIPRRGYRLIAKVVFGEPSVGSAVRFPVRRGGNAVDDTRRPYPGLAAFTEADAEYFFGRESEIEQMWRKLERPHLMALIGPSGAGKSSFIRAGLLAAAPSDWSCLVCTPGDGPVLSLGRVLARAVAGDPEIVEQMLSFDDPNVAVDAVSRWRRRIGNGLLVVDQFEELFTQNTPEVQRRFSDLLGRLVIEGGVHVLLSMRDDFLFRCSDQPALAPVYSELTPLRPLSGAALRRAVVQPAMRSGYRFEDDELVDEVLAEVEGERGVLPLLAFAMARLWEKRDRENGLITRQAYRDIGGVGGALARHAEATIDRIGADRIGCVRELFRNLVTAEGTRAVRELAELLSVFGKADGQNAEEVLRSLIDARLVTSYEVHEEVQEATRRVEIIHESLLAAWPRLVRWQTQDADAVQLRDQLRQAARTWDEHDRSDDLLWTGSAYREFASWRERYPGGLSDIEDAFGSAMITLAGRRRRRRRSAVGAVIAALIIGLTVVGSFWQRSVHEARRAEAAKLLALGQAQLETDPTEALAFAIASLELADTYESRTFTMKALWEAPMLRALDAIDPSHFPLPVFSPDGRWLALGGFNNEYVLVWNEAGGAPIVLDGHAVIGNDPISCAWTRNGLLVTGHRAEGRVRVWEMPVGRLVRTIEFTAPGEWQVGESHLLRLAEPGNDEVEPRLWRFQRWKLPDGEVEDFGSVDLRAVRHSAWIFDPTGNAWLYARGNAVYRRQLPIRPGVPDAVAARHSSDGVYFRVGWGTGFFSRDENGEIIQWTTNNGKTEPVRTLRKPETATTTLISSASGRWVVNWESNFGQREGFMPLWDVEGMPGVRPIHLRRSGSWQYSSVDFHPYGEWVVSSSHAYSEISFWPLRKRFATVVEGYETFWQQTVGFTPDGRFLITNWSQDRVRLWPLPGEENLDVVDLMLPSVSIARSEFAIDPTGQRVFSAGYSGDIYLLSLNGGDALQLGDFPDGDLVLGGDFSPSGRFVAGASLFSEHQPTLRLWDLESGEVRVFDHPKGNKNPDVKSPYQDWEVSHVAFADETTLYTSGNNGLLRWDLESGTYEQIVKPEPGGHFRMSASVDRRRILTVEVTDQYDRRHAFLHDVDSGSVRQVEIPGESSRVRLGPEGELWVTGEEDGSIWVGRFDGGEAHLLAGHEGPIKSVAISPDRKWIASSGEDKTLRLWPMPDLSKPPLHTLPREELIAKLKTLTNLRVVRDEESSAGWKVEIGPFPGWETVPTW